MAITLAGCATTSHYEKPDVTIQVGDRHAEADPSDVAPAGTERIVVRVNERKGVVEINGTPVASFDAPEVNAKAEVVIEAKPDGKTTVTANGVRVAEVKE
jgi:hypothetical protein